jgi:phage tail-like protein
MAFPASSMVNAGPMTQSLGMAHRFSVVVGGHNLGDWAKCSGLKVTWDKVEHRPGDVVNGVWFYPGTAKYEPIKLSRAADINGSVATRMWLSGISIHNMPTSGTITMYDSYSTPVCSWNLDNMFPLSWDIDSFDAGASKVALENLSIIHSGFLMDEAKIGPLA